MLELRVIELKTLKTGKVFFCSHDFWKERVYRFFLSFKRDDLQQKWDRYQNQSLVGLVGFGENPLELNGNPLYLLLRKTLALGKGKHLLLCIGFGGLQLSGSPFSYSYGIQGS